jgi:subtilase family serine protease
MHILRIRRTVLAAAAVGALATIGLTPAAAQAQQTTAYTPIAGSAVPFTGNSQATGQVAGSTSLTIQAWLTPDIAGAQQYATAVSTPGGAQFQHYLSPNAYAARFGASASAAANVTSWLRGQGFTGVTVDPQRSYVTATAPVSTIDSAFHTQIDTYKSTAQLNAGAYPLRANSEALSIPGSLSSSVVGITGIDNAAPTLPLDRLGSKTSTGTSAASTATSPACSNYYGQYKATGQPKQFGTTSFPTVVCGYSADQLRAAYGADSTNTGKGQTIALVEVGLTQDMFLTLQDYAAANHLPAPSSERYSELSLGQGSACGDPFDVEEQLDVESSYAVAPGASQLVVGGDSCNDGYAGLQAIFDADLAVLNGAGGHPLATVASNSWESGGEYQAATFTDIEHDFLVQAAAEGVGMYFSSGDGSGVGAPSDDPYATAVGGTTLGLGASANRLFETGWSTGISELSGSSWSFQGEQGASGGGASLEWAQPSYQTGVVPTALATAAGNRGGLVRTVPDISADADPFTGIAVGLLTFPASGPPTYSESDIGGTSLAAPLVAGIVTSAQQGQAKPFGFINPALYKLAKTDAYHDVLPITGSTPTAYDGVWCPAALCGAVALTTFDDQSYDMDGYTGQVSLKGYDTMSGIGSPNGQDFVTALRHLEQ